MTGPGAHDFSVVSTEDVHIGRVVGMRVDDVVMPGGSVARREVVEHLGAVAIAAVDDDGAVTLIHQYRHPLRRRLWELPAGLLDVDGEEPVETARRELLEEAGLTATRWDVLVDVAASPGFTDEVVRVFLARGLARVDRTPPASDEEADLVVHRVPLPEAVRMALAGELVNGSTVAGVLAAHTVLAGQAQPRPVDAPWPTRPATFAGRRVGQG
ncbi:MAG TPA: NUDIX hydrolase [Amycolatopsis sp.]|uniref:NUDIX hydrolase n=1 Tax=Amycolatopsis sp. TaxID=37632 RepID=UPI002B46E0D7|nr:NUDIX hydrolase [Amycolatopsis sp.]HKS45473.1 NUDIX hydrolase [Amycolatopsis sp.]